MPISPLKIDGVVQMITKICTLTSEGVLELTKQLLFDKQVVAIPTETVYGLAAKLYPEALAKIFAVKQRPHDNPLIVHIYNTSELNDLVLEITNVQKSLMDKFWPGPLTILFRVKDSVPKIVTAGLDTIAIRCPAHPITREILKHCGALAAPSANTSGKPSPTSSHHVYTDLNGKIPLIIDGGPCSVGVESTVCNPISDPPLLLRPGFISLHELHQVKGMENCVAKFQGKVATSPGMKYKHYEPSVPVCLVISNSVDFSVLKFLKEPFAIMRDASLPISDTQLSFQSIKGDLGVAQPFSPKFQQTDSHSYLNDPIVGNVDITIADMRLNLFEFLRILDGENGFPKKASIVAFLNIKDNEDVYNRLSKAASYILKEV